MGKMIAETLFEQEDIAYIRRRLPEVLEAVKGNVRPFESCRLPLPVAGACYNGIWMEHNQDWFFLAELMPESAWAAVEIFMERQKENGLFPVVVRMTGETAYRQVQNIWPFARCAFEIAKKLNKGEQDLVRIYQAGAAYDRWLGEFRDHKQLGLVEMFCEYDTGHDKSPRVTDGGLPHNMNPDAGTMPDLDILPILAPAFLAASTAPTRVTLGKSCPFATICVPRRISALCALKSSSILS